MNNHSDSHLPFPIPSIHHNDVVSTTATTIPAPAASPQQRRIIITNPRKKRSKLVRIDGLNSPSKAVSPSPKRVRKVPDPEKPKITMPCSECGKKFWSWKALFGHMRCHPERQWRGINPPPNLRRPFSEEEYDVASCLLLLASGRPKTEDDNDNDYDEEVEVETDQNRLFSSSNFHDHDRFECSSCKKVFGSHQALGGHRASHKNVKGCFAIAKIDEDDDRSRNDVVLEVSDKKMTMELGSSSGGGHKCSVCLRVFSSGQALGGHKRCHWEKFGDDSALSIQALNTINGGLDLNFPATLEEFDYSSSSLTLDLRLGL